MNSCIPRTLAVFFRRSAMTSSIDCLRAGFGRKLTNRLPALLDVPAERRFLGLDAYRAFYEKTFAEFPKNHAKLLNRIVVGSNVIDHEHVDRGNGDAPFQVAAIYTFKGDKIVRVDFAR